MNHPSRSGYFGSFGGCFVPETLVGPLRDLAESYARAKKDPGFRKELGSMLRDFAGRPTPWTFARRLSRSLKGARIYLKREDLAHTGAHKINN
ncbi:MAG: tryptophan synthase subunit beta, partial [Elusimicrobiota bacterium]